MNSTSHNPWRKEKDNHTYIYYQSHLYCFPEQAKPYQGRGKTVAVPPPDAARGGERVGKNKGELSGLRRANSDAVDNETNTHD